jgi:hypothetical protein
VLRPLGDFLIYLLDNQVYGSKYLQYIPAEFFTGNLIIVEQRKFVGISPT